MLLPLMGVATPVFPIEIRNARRPPKLIGMGLLLTEASGLPRSHASSSLSPKIWQLAQDASPLPERLASYSIGRPLITDGGSGFGSGNAATSLCERKSTTLTESSKRVMT